MQRYLTQLPEDINAATVHITAWFEQAGKPLQEWMREEEEEQTAPVRSLEECTGIEQYQLPPATMLANAQINALLQALKQLLHACNCHFVLQTEVPKRIQYETIRIRFNQYIKIKRYHMGFFELCRPATVHGESALGQYCQCAFYEPLFSHFSNEPISPEDERAIMLDIEIRHIQKKYGNNWMK